MNNIYNWYRKILLKSARRGNVPLMDQYSYLGGKDKELSEPESLTKFNPYLGGEERSTSDGAGYPRGVSQHEDSGSQKGGQFEIPAGRTILDDDIFLGEGANDERFMPENDKFPKEKREPVGAHNMQEKNVFDYVSKKSRIKSLNKI